MREKGVSSVSLAKKVGVTTVTMSNLINNKTAPSLDTIERIATALNVPLWQLFTSPEEIQQGNIKAVAPTITCPHCGKVINVKVDVE